MDAEQRIKALEDEFEAEKKELKAILLDIRAFVMEAQSPIRRDSQVAAPSSEAIQ